MYEILEAWVRAWEELLKEPANLLLNRSFCNLIKPALVELKPHFAKSRTIERSAVGKLSQGQLPQICHKRNAAGLSANRTWCYCLGKVVSRAGLEPATHWLKVRTVRAVPKALRCSQIASAAQPLSAETRSDTSHWSLYLRVSAGCRGLLNEEHHIEAPGCLQIQQILIGRILRVHGPDTARFV